jgi:hypothetical protein
MGLIGHIQLESGDLSTRQAIVQFTERGLRSGCPFCKGRSIAGVSTGDRIVFLKGRHSGQTATVSNQKGLFPDEFLVKFDFQPPNHEMRVSYLRDEFAFAPIESPPPAWLCELSIDDLCAVENAIINFVAKTAKTRRNIWNAENLLSPISTVWRRRLPVMGSDLWPAFESHGILSNQRLTFCRYFDFGIDLLISMHGRPAIKKRRVKAMSIGRYLTPGQEEYGGPSPGVTS